jgi:hypothetical protein
MGNVRGTARRSSRDHRSTDTSKVAVEDGQVWHGGSPARPRVAIDFARQHLLCTRPTAGQRAGQSISTKT